MTQLPEISKKELALLRSLSTRGGRKHSGCCRCEGVRAVRELLDKAPDTVKFIAGTQRGFEAFKSVPEKSRQISEERLSEISDTINTQGIIAVAVTPEQARGPVAMSPFQENGNWRMR